ncbi:hypothetical protein [Trueperella pecoris]|uniref:Transposase n=1 Tax=Trueperella pecoris TaxID=2733571 RepID=A0A8A5UGT0_9ACTO|nr:hypothetical protein [Trueperella pecoris]QOR44874.1 hypothetical protein INS88_06105 [Trueperella pecoris]QTG75187.1 hypothetical protein J4179_08185 [Trueperella pecoris]QTG75455.1 hypothetical protein J4179_09710 [Trueperella pecoris]QTG75468.1 hypothetical protein J4179_09780 [Trueperella pecoris]QTG75872.1 hypothetical protein J4179_02055 [Trueperella pecoris]
MSIRFLSAAEKLDLVTEYLGLQQGQKGAWLKEHGIAPHSMLALRRQYFAGDLDRGLLPRKIDDMPENSAARLLQLEKLLVHRDEEITRLEGELDKARQVNDVLGKAIRLVERLSDPDEPTHNEKSS